MNNHLLAINVEKAKKRLVKLQSQVIDLEVFIGEAETYNAESFEQKVIKEYAYLGSLFKVTAKLNKELLEMGEEGKLKMSDISSIIESQPIDELHKNVRKIYRTNKKNLH
ncbi:hypothetical protein SAMN05444673_2883 [Bacillus sp. OV166]|uniref:hypothetical protein n=1 Tax=Bacillus sp. OV166 TaxID=1882763 RepID=UPI000A2AD08D|nr:hypothetical protein [Bacillus sp. OV166]SMQ77549.1 hypothetical protein SAMN05444673_2883 [Bacillus sp. OV166]